MSRDVMVSAKQKTPIPVADILSRLRELGSEAAWKADPFVEQFTRPRSKAAWRAGFIVSAGESDSADQITISNERLKKAQAPRRAESYRDMLTETQRQDLMAAETLYRLSVGWPENSERERRLAGLAVALAELGDGLILDPPTNQFFEREAYRRRYPNFFKQ